ncbi:hypothetical protein C0993_011275 [Termitomyces sp. T159_Od127]|nr:hypothetical protein C0993_011275 [Termitomyces sp. T159_Od127]
MHLCRINPHPGPDDDSHYPDVKSLSKDKPLSASSGFGDHNTVSTSVASGSSKALVHEGIHSGDIISDSGMLKENISTDLPIVSGDNLVVEAPIHDSVNVQHSPALVSAFSASISDPGHFSSLVDSHSVETIATESHSLEDEKSSSDEELDDESEEEFELELDESGYLSRRPALLTPENIVKNTIQQLAGYQLVVDSNFNRIICLVCQSLIPFERVHRHAHGHIVSDQQRLSKARQIPSQEDLEQLLILLNAHQPVTLGTMPIPPFEGIDITMGIKCEIPSCPNSYLIHSNKKVFYQHCTHFHPNYLGKDRLFSKVHCQALSQTRQERQIREISYLPTTADIDGLTGILEYTASIGLGVLSTTYIPPTNTHARSLLLDHMEWHQILKDVDIAQLRPTAYPALEKSEPHLYHLQKLVKQYYVNVSKQLGQLDILTRRLIRSPEPKSVTLII